MSKIEVNTVEPQCGTTLTLGGSGDTVTLGTCATQSGFGRTGTVDWITTVKVTGDSPITGVTAKGYFLNTTSGTITVNLPAGAAGSILAFKDYAGTWDTNAVTVTPDGSEKIAGVAGSTILSTERQSVTLIYIDSTQGWLDIHDSASDISGPKYVTATGGTPCAGATSGDYKIHTFTGPGTLVVSCGGNASGSNEVDYLVVAGGGSGGTYVPGSPGSAGGGGAGGFRESKAPGAPWTASPIVSSTSVPVTATPYAIVVGGGASAAGPGAPSQGSKGNDSSFSTITSTGGGYGGNVPGCPGNCGGPGGSGGGAGGTGANAVGGTGNTPTQTPAQGKDGGDASHPGAPNYGTGGGGGATEEGADGTPTLGGRGGAGATTCISASPVAYAGGGGGSTCSGGTAGAASPCGTGGAGKSTPGAAPSGTTNRGGGGGGHGSVIGCVSGAGGSGIVIIRYKFQ